MKKFQNALQKDFTAHPSKYPQKNFKPKPCRWCAEVFQPIAPCNHYCSDQCRREVASDKHYRRVYGVGVRWVQQQLEVQKGKCAICKTTGFKMREDHVSGMNLDHCHKTGKARALLCHNCNRGLGLLQDDPWILRRAADYVERYADDTPRDEEPTTE